jgi:hypothetical protein
MKAEYHDHKAEVTAVLATRKKIRVKLLEGPRKDSQRDYAWKCLSRMGPAKSSASTAVAVAAAAGTEDLDNARADRKRRAEVNAARLFGKLPKLFVSKLVGQPFDHDMPTPVWIMICFDQDVPCEPNPETEAAKGSANAEKWPRHSQSGSQSGREGQSV